MGHRATLQVDRPNSSKRNPMQHILTLQILSHFTDFTGYVLFIITSFLAGVESTDQCLLNSKVLSCFYGVIMSIRSFFLLLSASSHIYQLCKVIMLIKRSFF